MKHLRRPPPPETIKIGAHTYRVLRKPAKDMGDDNGRCYSDKLEIHLVKRLRFSRLQEFLFHEVMHAVASPALAHTRPKTQDEFEEAFVETLAGPLVQVLKDNPRLVEFLCWKEGV